VEITILNITILLSPVSLREKGDRGEEVEENSKSQ